MYFYTHVGKHIKRIISIQIKHMAQKINTLIALILITSIQSFCQTTISGLFSTDTKLGPTGNPADSVYIISGNLYVYGTDGPDNITTLTIESGVTLKFSSSARPNLEIGSGSEPGRLVARGTSSNRITFTSSSSNPSHGDWGCISLNELSKNCILEYVDMLYGGDDWAAQECCLAILDPDGTNLTISNCNINYSESRGICVDGLGFNVDFNNVSVRNSLEDAIYLENIDESTSISFLNCSITDNDGYGILFLDDHPTQITNCTFANNGSSVISCYANQVGGISNTTSFQNSTTIEIQGGTISHDSYWSNFSTSHEVNYYIYESIKVSGNDGSDGITTLEIEAGSKILIDPLDSPRIKISIGSVFGPGCLIAKGTAAERIIFMSAAESPEPGDWKSIFLAENSSDCELEYVDILYGGGGNNSEYSLGIFGTEGSDMNISNCSIMHSETSGISIDNEGFNINISNSILSNNIINGSFHGWCDTNTTISYENCEISNNGSMGIKFGNNESMQVSNCTFSNNAEYAIGCNADKVKDIQSNNVFQNEKSINILYGTVSKDATWHDFYTNYNVSYYSQSNLRVMGYDGPDSITTLVLEPGTRIAFNRSAQPEFQVGSSTYGPGQLIAQGSFAKRITLTTSGDEPYPGNWKGLSLTRNSKDCILENVDILYGGDEGSTYGHNLLISKSLSTNLSITNSRFLHSSNYGIVILGAPDSLLLNNNTISNNAEHGIYIIYASDIMGNYTQNNIYDNGGYGIMNVDDRWIDATNCYWGSNDGPGGVGPGTGDKVSDYVLYEPWSIDSLAVNLSEKSDYESLISIYPNPARDYIRIKSTLKDKFPYTVTIYNNKSQVVYQQEVTINNSKISLSNIKSGVYFILFQDFSGKRIHSQALIIK